jgi:molybdopterin converting factor subunit 1
MEHFEVRLFASFADLFGAPNISVTLPRGSTVEQLTSALHELPAGGSLPQKLVVAVNHTYVPAQTVLKPTDEIALIPPVAGG